MEAGKCENEKFAKKCKKTCDMCEDEGPKKSTIPNLDLFDILSSFSYWTLKSPNTYFQGVSNRNFSINNLYQLVILT